MTAKNDLDVEPHHYNLPTTTTLRHLRSKIIRHKKYEKISNTKSVADIARIAINNKSVCTFCNDNRKKNDRALHKHPKLYPLIITKSFP